MTTPSAPQSSVADIRPGLVSVTFRRLGVERIVALAAECELKAIEWGGDIHVPTGDLGAARAVRKLCDDAGVIISAYGSYYRSLGDTAELPFEKVLATAAELGAPSIRVWAGSAGSEGADAGMRSRIADDLARICAMSAKAGIEISLEFHSGTLTDSASSTLELLESLLLSNLFTYWQPRDGDTAEAGVRNLMLLRRFLGNLHVFHWWPDYRSRRALSEGADQWKAYLKTASADGRPRFASLEFIRADSEEQLRSDAGTLIEILQAVKAEAGSKLRNANS